MERGAATEEARERLPASPRVRDPSRAAVETPKPFNNDHRHPEILAEMAKDRAANNTVISMANPRNIEIVFAI